MDGVSVIFGRRTRHACDDRSLNGEKQKFQNVYGLGGQADGRNRGRTAGLEQRGVHHDKQADEKQLGENGCANVQHVPHGLCRGTCPADSLHDTLLFVHFTHLLRTTRNGIS